MATDAFSDFVVGHGELWSAQLMAACMTQLGADVRFMDTRDVLVVTPTSDGSSVDLDEAASNAKLDAWFQAHGKHKASAAACLVRLYLEQTGMQCRVDVTWLPKSWRQSHSAFDRVERAASLAY